MTRIFSQEKTTILLLLGVVFGFAELLSIIAVGDIMMGTTYPVENLPPHQGKHLFSNLYSILWDADLTLGNLEGTLLEGGVCAKKVKKGRCYAFRTPPDFVYNLKFAGFDFMNCANNHMNDFGADGIASTLTILDSAGIKHGGPYGEIGEFSVHDQSIAIACFATSPNTDLIFDIRQAQLKVGQLARENDIVIVSFHGGGEGLRFLHVSDTFEYFLGSPRGNVVAFAHAVVDSGADLVWGHGPHVPRALELYKDRLIAYSLGNFCTWGFNVSEERGYVPILKVSMDSTGVFKNGCIISARQQAYEGLILDSLNLAARLIQRLSNEDFPEMPLLITDDGIITRYLTDQEKP